MESETRESDAHAPILSQIEEWYERAPASLTAEERIDWVQENSEIACPDCGEWLWVMRGQNAGDRGMYHLAICQAESCDFQAAD